MNDFFTNKRQFVRFLFLIECIFCFSTVYVWAANHSTEKLSTVVIDPGHGGKDPGALGKVEKEKNVVLDIALRVGKYIEEECKGVKVLYTRKTDEFVPLYKRAEIANKNNADLFISIHANASENHRVTGASTFAMGLHKSENNLEVAKRENSAILMEENYKQKYEGFNPKSSESYIIFSLQQSTYLEQSINFASYVQNNFSQEAKRKNRGVRQAGFLVLWRTSMPSVLVETGFITNPTEEQYLISDEGQKTIARSIYKAFLNYKKAIESKSHFVSSTNTPYNNADESGDGVIFKVQILSSDKKLPDDAEAFKGLSDVYEYKSGDAYKYAVGSEDNYEEILKVKEKVKKYFPGAFVIAIKDGKRISIDQALKLTAN